jgi:hypothetical protein
VGASVGISNPSRKETMCQVKEPPLPPHSLSPHYIGSRWVFILFLLMKS